jgi:transcriptional regulator GlxA family with amidase domain
MPLQVVLLLYPGVQSLDVTGPAEVFAHAARQPGAPRYVVTLASPRGGKVQTSAGFALDTVALRSLAKRKLDTVLVAGGNEAGVRAAVRDERLLEFVRKAARKARRIGSVCSGAFVLAAAGLLDGLCVATHWSAAARLAEFRPALSVDADAIFITQGKLWTSAGVTTGIDMSLAMVERDAGRRVADAVAAELVLHARRPGFQSQFSSLLTAQLRAKNPLGDALNWAGEHLATLDVPSLAKHAGVSVRTLHRLCKDTAHTTPGKRLERLRSDRARVLLSSTDAGLKEIAATCGYRDASQLSRAFSRTFGVSPSAFRMLTESEPP